MKVLLKSLEEGKTAPADNPAVALSPFAPEEKKEKFEEGLSELAGQVKGAIPTIEAVAEPSGAFAGFRLILRQKQNPLQVTVRAICVLRTAEGWKVAAGLESFDNTNFGFEEGLGELARKVAETTRRDAGETGRRMLAQGAEALWKDIRSRRESWPATGSPEDQVKRFLEYDRTEDAVGKLACFHITPDLPAANLERFLTLLSESSYAGHADEDEEAVGVPDGGDGEAADQPSTAKALPLWIHLGGKEAKDNVCRVVGFLSPEDPSDYYVHAFYLRKGEGNRWLIVPDGYEVEGLRSPDSELVEWYEENEVTFGKQLIHRLAEQARSEKPAPPRREDGPVVAERYLNSLATRKIDDALAMLDLPAVEAVDDFDGLMDELAKERWRIAPPSSAPPVILPMRWKEIGDFGGAVHAIYQPQATRPFLLHLQMARWTKDGWRMVPPTWDEGPESIFLQEEARKLQTELEAGWNEMKRLSVTRIFGETKGLAEQGAEPEKVVRQLVTTAFARAAAGQESEFLSAWKVPAEGAADPVAALEMAARLGRDLRKTGQVAEPEIIVRGAMAGILLPVNQAKREDGQKPARLIIARRENGIWCLTPGLEFFRPINRGFKELNQKALAAAAESLDETGRSDLKDLLSWLEQSPPEPKEE